MSSIYKVRGIILKRKIYGESDKFITLFTQEFGKLTVLAKGIRKVSSKRSGHLEVFSTVNCSIYKGKNIDYLAEVVAISHHPEFHSALKKASCGYYLCELVDRLLPEHQEHPEVYDALNYSLSKIAKSEDNDVIYQEIYDFALNVLRILGFLPITESISKVQINSFIENVIERKLKTLKLLDIASY